MKCEEHALTKKKGVIMDYKNIGKFIADIRKEKGYTQKELANLIGVSDKTISKWECGNGIPDLSYMDSLCESLGISINELISGQKLQENSYPRKAEENIMMLMKENANNKKSIWMQSIIGVVFFIIFFIILFSEGLALASIIDPVGFLSLALLLLGTVLLSGKKEPKDILDIIRKMAFPGATLITACELIVILTRATDAKILQASLAVLVLEYFYASIIYFVLFIIQNRKK